MNNDKDTKQEIHQLYKMMDKLSGNVEAIKNALLGTEFGDKGLVKRVDENEREIEKIRSEVQKYKWIVLGISFTSTVFFNIITKLIP